MRKVNAIAKDVLVVCACVIVVFIFSAITFARLGYIPAQALAPVLYVQPAQAATWESRVGRLYWNGNPAAHSQVWWCDNGYWISWNHFNISNKWNSLWPTCITGAW